MVENSSDLHAQSDGGIDIDLLVVEKERLFGSGTEFLKRVKIDLRVGFGDAQLIAPDENVELFEPLEFALDAAQGLSRPYWRGLRCGCRAA